jgi:pyridoxal phosphate enzyme (YggS family)
MAADGLIDAQRRIVAAAERSGRDPDSVRLVVVSKGQSDEAVQALYTAGHRVFAENRADSLLARRQGDLPADITWHFVGTVQRRKASGIAAQIELLHSMDRDRLELAWANLSETPAVLLQVNLAGEPQKQGYRRDGVLAAADRLLELGVGVRGLMALPPAPDTPEDSRRWFTALADLGQELRAAHPRAEELSMGMSDDFEVAVECGSTMVRLGRTIFGERND